jgi:hypothetical protein
MSKTQSKIGITIPETPPQENYVYSAYFQYDGGVGVSYGEIYNNFPSTPVWSMTGVGIIETTSGFGYTFGTKDSVEVLVSKSRSTGISGASSDYHISAGITGGPSDDITIEILDSAFVPTNDFGAFYLRVTVYQ